MTAAVARKAHVWPRAADEWYVEPEDVTDALLTRETFEGIVLDPACGGGNIPRAMRRHGIAAFGSDIVARGLSITDGWLGEANFLERDTPAINIACNPPFGRAALAEAFIRKALSITVRKVAMFVDVRFIAGAERAKGIFAEFPPHRVWVIAPRCSCPPGTWLQAGNKAGNGTTDFCWMVWDFESPRTGTQLGWVMRPKAVA